MESTFAVYDFLQDATDFKEIILLKYVTFFASTYIFYNFVSTSTFIQGLKLFFIVVIARYLLSLLTRYKNPSLNSLNNKSQKYFQIDPTIAYLYLMIVLYIRDVEVSLQIKNSMFIALLFYSIFSIGSKSILTSDAIFTLLFADMIFRNLQLIQVN
uniref:Uncharacterized protein n=1 Tax=viral metagenome TaxID=1070528 RepID=A0A6C0E0M5_9ZZZZ